MAEKSQLTFIFIPGLGDDWLGFIRLTKEFCDLQYKDEYNADFQIFRLHWRQGEKVVLHRFKKLSKKIKKSKNPVILCGISAGATPALLLTMMYPDKIQAVITFGGWIKYDRIISLARNQPFKNFVVQFTNTYLMSSEESQQKLLDKVICINPKKDWLVPRSARMFPGDTQPDTITIPFYEHYGATTIGLLALFARLKSQPKVEKVLNTSNGNL